MTIREQFRHVLVMGGTHGNELAGVYLIKQWRQAMSYQPKTYEVATDLANVRAIEQNRRYCAQDLNRCFSLADLQDVRRDHYEAVRAREIAHFYTQEKPVDFIIDLHTTTTEMGATVVVSTQSGFMYDLLSYLVQSQPDVRVFYEPGDLAEQPYLYTLGRYGGILVEIGQTPQGLLRADVFLKTVRLVELILKFLDIWNECGDLCALEMIPAFEFLEKVYCPVREGVLDAMIHPSLQGADYQPLQVGDPIFLRFTGEVICYEGVEGVCPVFVNEAAYYDTFAAFTLMKKIQITRGS